jgi:hypothetical protein
MSGGYQEHDSRTPSVVGVSADGTVLALLLIRRQRRFRSGVLVKTALIAALAVTLAGCGRAMAPPTPTPSSVPLTSYSSQPYGISFSYPASWHVGDQGFSGSLYSLVAYVSTQEVHDPCIRQPSTITCGWPITSLDPGNLVVTWGAGGSPGWQLAGQAGQSIEVDGHPAKLERSAFQTCVGIMADRSMTVTIYRGPSNYFRMQACFREPLAADHEAQVLTVLRSVRLVDHA